MHTFMICVHPLSLSWQDNVKTTEELSRILESTRDHLESQLNRKDTENSILAAQIQVSECEIKKKNILE